MMMQTGMDQQVRRDSCCPDHHSLLMMGFPVFRLVLERRMDGGVDWLCPIGLEWTVIDDMIWLSTI